MKNLHWFIRALISAPVATYVWAGIINCYELECVEQSDYAFATALTCALLYWIARPVIARQ